MNHKRHAEPKPQSRSSRAISAIRSNISNPFRLDLRSLAVYRVGLGLILIFDAATRWVDLTAHYTDQGVLPLDVAEGVTNFSFSLHYLIDGWWWPALLFALQILAGITLTIGYRTRLSIIISWILLISIQNRNPIVLNGADNLLRVQLFWSIFLPLNARFSLDIASGRVVKTLAKTAFSPATIAIVVQTVLLYVQTAALKTGTAWRETNEALFIALNAEQFTSELGTWLTQFRTPMRILTKVSILIEDFAALFILNPFFGQHSRFIGFLLIASLHVGIASLMFVGLFPAVSIITIIPLVPGFVWEKLGAFVVRKRKKSKLTVYYDTSCGICQKFVKLLAVFAVARNEVELRSIYDNKAILKKSDAKTSWVAKSGNKHYFQAEVFREILDRSYVWWVFVPLLRINFVANFANTVYHQVAHRRSSVCKPPKPVNPLKRDITLTFEFLYKYATGAFILVMLAATVMWVWADMPRTTHINIGQPYRKIIKYTRLDQRWNMFAPSPFSNNTWYIVKGETEDGRELDVWRHYWADRDDRFITTRPDHTYRTYVGQKWRRYLVRIQNSTYSRHREYFLNYMCKEWNTLNPHQKVINLELIMMQEPTRIDDKPEKINKITQEITSCD